MNDIKRIAPVLLLFVLHTHFVFSQRTGMWQSSFFDNPITDFSMKLKGPVQSWTMTKPNGESRTITYAKNGTVQSDTYKGTIQTYIPPDFMLIKLKNNFEKTYPPGTRSDTTQKFNDRMQLTERKQGSSLEINVFDADGKILIHQQGATLTETRAWNSLDHPSPTYTFTVKTRELVIFRYNEKGALREIEYFNNNPFENIKMVYLYDGDNLVETNRYDHYNISVGNMPDNYLERIPQSKIDTAFSIDDFFKNYWGVGTPSVNKWKYNEKGQKIEYSAYGYMKGLSFQSMWQYDEQGRVLKETHWNVFQNRVHKILYFDEHGNVIRENDVGYDGKEDAISEMKILYY